jgi:hypothetical protein|tara:strand:- start:302 stop:592 length:291 start_codon:yes stop_codon:yes gene_type:complete
MDEILDMMKKTSAMLENLDSRIRLLADITNVMTSYLGERDSEFRNMFIMGTLHNDDLRAEFTEFLNQNHKEMEYGDSLITTMMEINETFAKEKEEE